MSKSTIAQCATAVSIFRGLYARVAEKVGVDVSFISRVARGQRRSRVAEKALAREYVRASAILSNFR